MNLSDLIPFLQKIGTSPKRGLSQNFLIDGNIAEKIVKTAGILPGDSVLEIGPGPGALTSLLLKRGAAVFAIEKDEKLASAFCKNTPRLKIFCSDALTFPFETLPKPLKAVANLPYHITTPLLEKLFHLHSRFTTLTLMMQKEVADRIFAKPSTKEFSSLTLFANFYTQCKARFTISSSCFYPRPKIDSSVIHLEMRKELPLQRPELFFKRVRKAFQQRRKMIRSSLKQELGLPSIERGLLKAKAPPYSRPEELSLEQWLLFFNEIDLQSFP